MLASASAYRRTGFFRRSATRPARYDPRPRPPMKAVRTVDTASVVDPKTRVIFRGLPKFRGDSALGTWIYRLSVNAALSHRSRRPPRADDSLDEVEAIPAAPPPDTDTALRSRLERALHRLPPGYRAVIVLHDV